MKKRQFVLISIILILAAVVLLWNLLPNHPTSDQPPKPTSTLTLRTETSRPRPTANPSLNGRKSGVAIPGWSSIDLPAETTEADVKLYNPTENDGKYNLVFELRLKDDGETLFTTGMVLPGTYCSHVTLSRPLPAGIYNGVMHVQPVRVSDQSPTNNADISVTVNVR